MLSRDQGQYAALTTLRTLDRNGAQHVTGEGTEMAKRMIVSLAAALVIAAIGFVISSL
jgi:hypothetical protein